MAASTSGISRMTLWGGHRNKKNIYNIMLLYKYKFKLIKITLKKSPRGWFEPPLTTPVDTPLSRARFYEVGGGVQYQCARVQPVLIPTYNRPCRCDDEHQAVVMVVVVEVSEHNM